MKLNLSLDAFPQRFRNSLKVRKVSERLKNGKRNRGNSGMSNYSGGSWGQHVLSFTPLCHGNQSSEMTTSNPSPIGMTGFEYS